MVMVTYCLFGFSALSLAGDNTWEDISAGLTDVRAILFQEKNPAFLLAGARGGVFKTQDTGKSWRNVLILRGGDIGVNILTLGYPGDNYLYAATDGGLFMSLDKGERWKRIFRGKNYLESKCRALAVFSNNIYLGTGMGLFISNDNGHSWRKARGQIGNSPIYALASDPKEANFLYVAALEGVFRTVDGGEGWKRVFAGKSKDDVETPEEANTGIEEDAKAPRVRFIVCDQSKPGYLYLATNRGVYASRDRGINWEPLSSHGLLSQEIESLMVSSDSRIYAVTKPGIFEYQEGDWRELSLELMVKKVNFLGKNLQGNLYAACDKGLFRLSVTHPKKSERGDIAAFYYKDEPKINEVQQAAVKYAEATPDKIKEWRRKAKMKAILPKLTIGLDSSQSTNYEIYTSATTRYVYDGPDDESRGWDMTLSWELGDLIWNQDQTAIDVRSKLMVELRNDILDEVTRIYFERLRVKMEIDNLSLEERKKRMEKELKLDELSASLDALTGGYFSSMLAGNSNS